LARIRDIGNESDNRDSGGFRAVEQRLRDERPALTALELDAIKLRTMSSSARKSPGPIARKKGNFMKSRLALVLVLALGVFVSGTGATLALSGSSSSGSASSAQYPETCHEEEASGKREQGSCSPERTCHEEEAANERSPGSCSNVPQETRQISSGGGGSLPFTGFLAIPVLIVGIGLLGAGVAMRLRMRSGAGRA
jgi:hypothetical protein